MISKWQRRLLWIHNDWRYLEIYTSMFKCDWCTLSHSSGATHTNYFACFWIIQINCSFRIPMSLCFFLFHIYVAVIEAQCYNIHSLIRVSNFWRALGIFVWRWWGFSTQHPIYPQKGKCMIFSAFYMNGFLNNYSLLLLHNQMTKLMFVFILSLL
jgi:hypothetical protein